MASQLRASRDDYFVKFDEQFQSRMPSDKDEMQKQLLEDEEIVEGWEEYQDQIVSRLKQPVDESCVLAVDISTSLERYPDSRARYNARMQHGFDTNPTRNPD